MAIFFKSFSSFSHLMSKSLRIVIILLCLIEIFPEFVVDFHKQILELTVVSTEPSSPQIFIGTHNGTMHADECLACSMLHMLPEFKSHLICRTRDMEYLNKCDIVVDVGGTYNHDLKRYDHHMREFKETFDEKHHTKLSSAGLIFKHYGKEIIKTLYPKVEDEDVKRIYNKMYKSLIEAVDGNDNGINQVESTDLLKYQITTDISSQIHDYNNLFKPKNAEEENDLFKRCMCLISTSFLEKLYYYCEIWLVSKNQLKSDFQVMLKSENPQILILTNSYPWKEHIYDIEDEFKIKKEKKTLFVIYQDSSNGSWRVQAVSISNGSFENRLSLLEEWRGLRDEELSKVANIADCIFVHASGFIGGNKTKEGALAMAIKTIEKGNKK